MNTLMRMYQRIVKGNSATKDFTKELERPKLRKFRVTLHIDDIEVSSIERAPDIETLVADHHDLWQRFDFASIEEVRV